jgi:hypothetical protein
MVRARNESAELLKLEVPLFSFISALSRGATLGDAMGESGLDEVGLRHALQFIFVEGLVISLA